MLTFESRALQKTYQIRFAANQKRRAEIWQVLSECYFQKFVRSTDTVLDIGAGFCEFSNSIVSQQTIALDLNPETAQTAKKNVLVISQDVTKPWSLSSDSVDLAFSSNFLEHLPDKTSVSFCLSEARRVLKPNGKLLLLGPNIRFCSDVYWDFFDHLIPLSDRSVMEALKIQGFEILSNVPRFLPFTMSDSAPPHPLFVKLYLKLPWVWHILGAQFFVVSRKRPMDGSFNES